MEYNKFENHISDLLRHDEAEMDVDEFIRNLHQPKNIRRPPLWLWISSIFSIALIIGGIYYLTTDNTQDTKQYSTTTINTNTKKQLPLSDITPSHLLPFYKQNQQQHIEPLTSSNDIYLTDAKVKKEHIYLTQYDDNQYDNTVFSKIGQTSENIHLITEKTTNTPYQNKNDQVNSEVNTFDKKQRYIAPLDYTLKYLAPSMVTEPQVGDVICPTFHKKGRFVLDILPEVGYFRPLKKLSYAGNEPDNIFNLRNQYESTLEGFEVGLYQRLMNDKYPVFLQTGVSYSHMTEKMPLDYTYTKRDTTYGIISITQSQSGDTVTVIYGDIIHENKITGRKVSHHHFSMIDLPISLGYEKNFGSWVAGVQAGIVLNLALKAGGQILSSDTSFTDIDQPVEAYKNRLDLSYFGELYIAKNFQNMGKFYLALRGRYIPDTFSSDYNRIRQSYHILGMHVGYVYSF